MNFVVDDLLPLCEKCEGNGKLENPVLKQNQGGIGTRVIAATPVDCDACNGRGVIPTETGNALLEFLRRAKQKGLLT